MSQELAFVLFWVVIGLGWLVELFDLWPWQIRERRRQRRRREAELQRENAELWRRLEDRNPRA